MNTMSSDTIVVTSGGNSREFPFAGRSVAEVREALSDYRLRPSQLHHPPRRFPNHD
jgi:hypothetical protein